MAVKRAARRTRNEHDTKKQPDAPAQPAETHDLFPIVAVGGGEGSVDAFAQLLSPLPEHPGVAFIAVIAGSDPRAQMETLRGASTLPVEQAAPGTVLRPNRIYLAPAAGDVTVEQGIVCVDGKQSPERPVDLLFRTVAGDQGSRTISVVLSGAAPDGALGTRAVKAEGGITFAQDQSAAQPAMPRAVVATGAVDFVLPPADIGREIARILRHSYLAGGGELPDEDLLTVFTLLHDAFGVDFTHYKPSTVERRIRRRMAVHKVDNLTDYVKVLRDNADEVSELYSDLLIRVTGFFRDPHVFEALQRDILSPMLERRADDDPIRVWVPGCATGEEAYSLAMAVIETVSNHHLNCPVQIFGTDISDSSIEYAREGFYPESVVDSIGEERLRRFFTRVEGGYRVAKAVRDCCIFARQNLTRDPPFSRLDLISCRNVLIYLGPALQRKVMSIFHYALKPHGVLVLGHSESAGSHRDLFDIVDRSHKFYRKKVTLRRMPVQFEAPLARPVFEAAARAQVTDSAAMPASVFREADRVLLSRFSPPGVLIDDNMEIVQFRGRTSAFFEPAPGAASLNILKMARQGLLSELRLAIVEARKTGTAVRRRGVRLEDGGSPREVNIEVIPFDVSTRERYFAVLFEEAPAEAPPAKSRRTKRSEERENPQVDRLKRELESTREYLQSVIEEQEAMNEELRSANEEIQSSNEELQSTNEELETAKEELQSSNEELTTLNEELEYRAAELTQVNNDLLNLLSSVDLAILMLDGAQRIRRFNPTAQRALGLIAADAGRPLADLTMLRAPERLQAAVDHVVETLETKEMEVEDRNGKKYLLRIRPYRTAESRIDGAVLVLIDVDQFRRNSGAERS
jgi:two-component system, chemotaxis family, CheB/CheR fusion protein